MHFYFVCLSALAAVGAFAKKDTHGKIVARQAAPAEADELIMVYNLAGVEGDRQSIRLADFAHTFTGPSGDFDGISFDNGADIDVFNKELRCRAFSHSNAGEDDIIRMTRGGNVDKDSFSKGAPWSFDAGSTHIAVWKCDVLEADFP